MRSNKQRLAGVGVVVVVALLVSGVGPASAGFPLTLSETLTMVPDESVLDFDLFVTQTTNRTAGTMGWATAPTARLW